VSTASGYVAAPAASLRPAGTAGRAGTSGTCALRMKQGGDAGVSRKAAMQLLGLTLAGATSAPQDAAAFVDNFYIPNVSDGAGGSISKAKAKGKAAAEKPPPAQVLALAEEGEEIIETEWGPYTKKAAEAGKKKGAGNLKCKAAIGGGQTCEGSKELEFTKAYDTKDGARTKVTGDKNKVSTYFSQIDAGYQTLVELADRWDEYIAAGDGDVVRRRLGTVGDKSPLHNVRKAFEGALTAIGKLPPDVVDEETLDWLDENSTAILNLIAEVDSNLYSTAFVGTEETSDVLRAQGKTALDKCLTKYTQFDKIIAGLAKSS